MISDLTSGKTYFKNKSGHQISLCSSFNLELLHLDKYQTKASTCLSASNSTSVVFKEHLIAFLLHFLHSAI